MKAKPDLPWIHRYALIEHHDDRDGRWQVAALERRVPDWDGRLAWACGPAGLLEP